MAIIDCSKIIRTCYFLAALLFLFCMSAVAFADDLGIVRFDFESSTLDGFTVIDGAFGDSVSERPLFHHGGKAYNKQGRWFFSTLETEDGSPSDSFTGIAESPVFTLEAPAVSMLVGGGRHPSTYVAICSIDGDEQAFARGDNAEKMQRVEWSLPALVGQKVFLRIVDQHTGGWGHLTFDDFIARGTVDHVETSRRFADLSLLKRQQALQLKLRELSTTSLRLAISDLKNTYPDEYPAEPFLERLQDIENEQLRLKNSLASLNNEDMNRADELIARFSSLKREALTLNPLLTRQPLLFIERKQYMRDHHNTATIFQAGEVNQESFDGGSAMKCIDFVSGKVRTLIELEGGVVRDPDIHFDAGKIVFSMRPTVNDDYHIYEINIDGSGLHQLTFAEGVSDIDPIYLPDESIVFSSTREPKFCMCNRHIMCNLFRMDSDGANIHQIGKSTLFEGHPSLLPDGRILYDRWEYIDRNFGDAQSLWTVNPDGTNHAMYWGNNTNSPGGVIDARIIPGTDRAMAVFSSCHDRPWGALAILERRLGMDLREPVIQTWPESAVDIVGHGNWDAFMAVDKKFEDPYPLSDKYFLCSRMTGDAEKTGLYLIDSFGNEILLHSEGEGCYDPMPIASRERPDIIPSRRNFDGGDGSFYVLDVYQGTHMRGVERGAVKYLRVIESPEKRTWNYFAWSGQGTLWPAMNWHDFSNKRILGTVPVEEDGSAFFSLPSDTYVYFQLLDKNGMQVQSMRSGTMLQSGETTGCVGCHDNRRSAPPVAVTEMPIALMREPSKLTGWYGSPRLFSYTNEVQPVLDASCLSCHDYGKKAATKVNLSGDTTNTFNTSYNELWRKGYVGSLGAGPSDIQNAYSWGSHKSRLVELLRRGHNGVVLNDESLNRIITWIDVNAPYYPVYTTAYPDNLAGRSPLTTAQLNRLTELTTVPFTNFAGYASNPGPQLNFERPELSPCLSVFADEESDEYREALGIIRSGTALLSKRPRADMDAFSACMIDQLREDKYAIRRHIEMLNRNALRDGDKRYEAARGSEGLE